MSSTPQASVNPDFNSIKVRLELLIVVIAVFVSPHFNSIKVRLELATEVHIHDRTTFQFHKGAIRTLFGAPS